MNTRTLYRFVALCMVISLSACGGQAAPTAQSQATLAPAASQATSAPAQPAEPQPTAAATETIAPTVTSAPAAPTAEPAAALPGDPAALLHAAMRKQLSSGPYRNTTKIVSDGLAVSGSGEFIPPSRLRIKTEIGGKTIEQIHIDGDSWSNNGDGWKASPGGQSLADTINAEFVEQMITTISDVKLIGPEVLDGRPTLKLTYFSDLSRAPSLGIPGKQTVTVWIGAADGLLYQQAIASEDFGVSSVTTQTITYDASIVIEKP
jgi:hypothetical protein